MLRFDAWRAKLCLSYLKAPRDVEESGRTPDGNVVLVWGFDIGILHPPFPQTATITIGVTITEFFTNDFGERYGLVPMPQREDESDAGKRLGG
jgi:hypothetical protein